MEQKTILSNTLNYIQYNRHPKNFHSLNISAVNKYRKSMCTKEETNRVELYFGKMLDILRGEYLDVYEGIQSEIIEYNKI